MDPRTAWLIVPERVVDPHALGGLEHGGLVVHRVSCGSGSVAGVGNDSVQSARHAWRRAAGEPPRVPDLHLPPLREMLARAGWWLSVTTASDHGPQPVTVEVYCPRLRTVHRATGTTGPADVVVDAVAACLEQLWCDGNLGHRVVP